MVLWLCTIGVTAFELIFEVSPRHIQCNVPCYIVLMAIGLCNLRGMCGRFRRNRALEEVI